MLEQTEVPAELYAEPNWYACLTRARAEKTVERLMVREGLEVYLPLMDVDRRWSDRTKRVKMPLFPGYVFARIRLGKLHDLLRIPGVSTILRPNGYPTPVREEEMASVRCLVNGVSQTGTPPTPIDFMQPGIGVLVVDGPFQGMRGILVEDRRRPRVAVRITALQQATSVAIPRCQVRALPPEE